MCDFCNGISSIPSRIPLIDMDISFGILGKSRLAIYTRNLEHGSYLDLYIDSYGVGAETVERLKKIHCCPVCGQQLCKEENYDN